ncbi:hypothetical protein ACFLZ0_02695 [Patescibacteria group bacterium]
MKKIIKIILNHKWAIICAVLVGIIIAAPQIYFRFKHKDIYHNIGLGGADETAYLSRIQEVRDGHYSTANYVWLEGKDLPYLIPSLSEIIANFTGEIFGLNIADTTILNRFIFPACILVIIYILLYQLISKKIIALVISITVLLSTELVNPRALFNLIFKRLPSSSNFLPFNRLIAPQIHLIFFFGFLLFFWFFIKRQKMVYKFLSGIVLGLSFYTYPYTWTFLFAFLGCLILIDICRKNWLEIKSIISIFSIALVISIPYFVNLWQAMQYPTYYKISLRYGIVGMHMPQAGAIVLILLAIFLLFFSYDDSKKYYFCLALVLTPLIVLNQQIITGLVLIPDHYHWYYHKPLAVIFILIIIFDFIDEKITINLLKRVSSSGLIIVILSVNFYNAWVVQSLSYKYRELSTIEFNKNYGILLDWLNDNAKKDEVALGNVIVSDLITMYTSLNSATSEDGHYTLIADEEQITERIFLEFRIDGLDEENVKEVFFRDRSTISASIYGQKYRKQFSEYGDIPDGKIYWLIDQYKNFLTIPIEDILRKYNIKYVIWDTVKNQNWEVDQYPFLEEIYQTERIKIYIL